MIKLLTTLIFLVSILSCVPGKKVKSKEETGLHTEIKATKQSTVTTVKDKDWDEYLDSYESYIDDYIKIMKKVKGGDASVATEYAEMMSKAADFSKKMEKAQGELTVDQVNRFAKLQTKLTDAITQMY